MKNKKLCKLLVLVSLIFYLNFIHSVELNISIPNPIISNFLNINTIPDINTGLVKNIFPVNQTSDKNNIINKLVEIPPKISKNTSDESSQRQNLLLNSNKIEKNKNSFSEDLIKQIEEKKKLINKFKILKNLKIKKKNPNYVMDKISKNSLTESLKKIDLNSKNNEINKPSIRNNTIIVKNKEIIRNITTKVKEINNKINHKFFNKTVNFLDIISKNQNFEYENPPELDDIADSKTNFNIKKKVSKNHLYGLDKNNKTEKFVNNKKNFSKKMFSLSDKKIYENQFKSNLKDLKILSSKNNIQNKENISSILKITSDSLKNNNLYENIRNNKINIKQNENYIQYENFFKNNNQLEEANKFVSLKFKEQNKNDIENLEIIQNLMTNNLNLKNSLEKALNSLKNNQMDLVKKQNIENINLIDKMKEKILNEIKPILKKIADMEFFTYSKIKVLETSFNEIKELGYKKNEQSIFNEEIYENKNEKEIVKKNKKLYTIENLEKIKLRPEIDDLSTFIDKDINLKKEIIPKNKNAFNFQKFNKTNLNKFQKSNLKKENFNDP